MTKILVADRQPVTRTGIEHIFRSDTSLEVVAAVGTGWEVLEHVRDSVLDVVVMGLFLSGPHGTELLHKIKEIRPTLPVLVLTANDEAQMAAIALKAGAHGYLVKDVEPAELLAAVHRVARGGRYIQPAIAERLAWQGAPAGDAVPHHALTSREADVFFHLIRGRKLAEIAVAMNISDKTVSTHKTRVMEKLGVLSNADLMRYAFRHGLVE